MNENHKKRKLVSHKLDPLCLFCQQKAKFRSWKRLWKVLEFQNVKRVQTLPPTQNSTIERSLLEELVERDSLNIKEVDLFKAVDNWATENCKGQGQEPNGAVKRWLLGEGVLNGVRFPVMKQKEFIGNVLEKKILTEEEGSGMIQYFTSGLSCPVGFSDRKWVNPQPYHRCMRFQSVSDLRASRFFNTDRDWRDFINVHVSKNILLHGVSLFGVAANTGVEIKNAILGSSIVTKWVKNCLNSSRVTLPLFSYYGYQVLFDQPVELKKDILYHIKATSSGFCPFRGSNGSDSVKCAGVKFRFEDVNAINNGSTVWHGQFPEFLFTLK